MGMSQSPGRLTLSPASADTQPAWGQGDQGTPQTRVTLGVADRLRKQEMVSESVPTCPAKLGMGGGHPSWAEMSILGEAAHLVLRAARSPARRHADRMGGRGLGRGPGGEPGWAALGPWLRGRTVGDWAAPRV